MGVTPQSKGTRTYAAGNCSVREEKDKVELLCGLFREKDLGK